MLTKKNRKAGEEEKTPHQHNITKDVKHLLTHVEKKLVKTFHEKPSRETLNRLAIFAGFQDWESFQQTLEEDKNPQHQ